MSLLSISSSNELPPIELQPLWGSSGDIMSKPHGKFGLLEYPESDEEVFEVYWTE